MRTTVRSLEVQQYEIKRFINTWFGAGCAIKIVVSKRVNYRQAADRKIRTSNSMKIKMITYSGEPNFIEY